MCVHLHYQQNQYQNNQDQRPSPPSDKVAKLVLNRVHIQESLQVQEWYVLTIDYAAYWPSSEGNGRAPPVQEPDALQDIERTVYETISTSILNDTFWNTLTSLNFGQELVLQRPSYDDLYEEDDKGLADCQMIYNEYDLNPYHEDKNGQIEDSWDSDDEESIPSDGGIWDDNTQPASNATYPDVIAVMPNEIVWSIREYIGLGIMVFGIVFVFLTSLISMKLQQRQQQKIIWGTPILTENGINDLLQVGWRYTMNDNDGIGQSGDSGEQPQPQTRPQPSSSQPSQPPSSQQQQLYLQVYDKGRIGYNDENSLLQGGIEQAAVVDATVPELDLTSTESHTTSTPQQQQQRQ